MVNRDSLARDAAVILAGMAAGLVNHPHQLEAPAHLDEAVRLALLLHRKVADATPPEPHGPRSSGDRRQSDRRREFGGWDTQEQQDADDAHRRVERRGPEKRKEWYYEPGKQPPGITTYEPQPERRRGDIIADHEWTEGNVERRKSYDHPTNTARD